MTEARLHATPACWHFLRHASVCWPMPHAPFWCFSPEHWCQVFKHKLSPSASFDVSCQRTLFTFWPPAPPDRMVVISRSDSGSSTSSTRSPALQTNMHGRQDCV